MKTSQLKDLPDVLTVNQLIDFLPIGRNSVYELLGRGEIQSIKIGRKYIIPKQFLLDYLHSNAYTTNIQTTAEPTDSVSFESEV